MNFRCSHGHNNRFKGKKSEISRGTKFECRTCGEPVIVSKKSNGKIVCQSSGNKN